MGIHRNAALTVRQRQELQRLRREEGWTIARLATHFRVNRSTVFR
ncbi:helix-turn-helix domain-containing protein [Herpetosiphon llansteffanensis]|nr:helix-turn-helix domain-containing protein [Herpetosiphon llansteffanensis]